MSVLFPDCMVHFAGYTTTYSYHEHQSSQVKIFNTLISFFGGHTFQQERERVTIASTLQSLLTLCTTKSATGQHYTYVQPCSYIHRPM